MLITLRNKEYTPHLGSLYNSADFGAFVEILAQCVQHGAHAMRAAPALIDALSKWPGLSDAQRIAFQGIARDVVNVSLPFDDVTDSLVLTGPGGPTEDPRGSVRWHRRDWTWLRARGPISRTVLAAENINDARSYRILALAWAAHLRPGAANSGSEVCLTLRGLGGGTAADELQHAIEPGDPIVCILDSDREHPTGALGSTAHNAIKRKNAMTAHALCYIEILQARDIENILPLQLVMEAMTKEATWIHSMKERGFFAAPRVDPDLSYIDLGKRQCRRRLLTTEDAATKNYREKALVKMQARGRDPDSTANSCPLAGSDDQSCEKAGLRGEAAWEIDDSCVLVHRVDKNVLRRVVDLAEARRRESSSAQWLIDLLHADDAVVASPARVAWSWGLGTSPRISSV